MKIENHKFHNVVQGSEEWHALRAKHFTASEAPAMLGVSKYQSRSELLRQKATGDSKEISPEQQRLFDRGHAAEAAARPIADTIVGDELLPATVTADVDGLPLMASCDGVTMFNDKGWEHKLYGQALEASVLNAVELGDASTLDEHYTVQMEQQLMLTGAESWLFMCSDGTDENCAYIWYETNPELHQRIVNGWKQFAEDLANYQRVETKAEAVAEPVKSLPAIHYELNGLELTSNLAEYREKAEQLVEDSQRELKTDQDFANAEERIKAFKTAEDKIKLVQEQVIGEIKSVDQFTRELGEIGELIRQARLASDKQVKKRKEDIRAEIITAAKQALADHIAAINETLDGVTLPVIDADFAGAMKGKKKIDSLKDAVDTVLAGAKIEANQVADTIRANLKTLDELGADHRFLFADLQQVITKPGDDFTALVKLRLSEHKAEEEKKEQERQEQARRDKETECFNTEAVVRRHLPSKDEPGHRAAAKEKKEDIVHRLRTAAATAPQEIAVLMQAAADEIDHLRGEVAA